MAYVAKFKDVTLADGRKVTVRNLNGADEMLALQLVGKQLKQDEIVVGMLLVSNMQFVLSMVLLDDQQIATPKNYAEALTLLGSFEKADLDKVREAYQELNGGTGADFLEK